MPSILLVEDDSFVRELVVGQLEALGHSVRAVEDAESALRLVDAGEPIDLLMTDLMLPGSLDGYGLSREVLARRPGLPVLYASGGGTAPAPNGPIAGIVRHLRKPFRMQQLARAIDEVIEQAVTGPS